MLARFHYISHLIEEFGLDRVREPHVKHLCGPFSEMRMKGRDGISRPLYLAAIGKRVMVVRVFSNQGISPYNEQRRFCHDPSK